MKKLINEGTTKDKVSAMSVYIKDNPRYTIHLIDEILTICQSHNKKNSLSAIN